MTSLLNKFVSYLKKMFSDNCFRVSFITSILSGFLFFGYAMFNIINNYDSVNLTPVIGSGYTASGRWALDIVQNISEFLSSNYNVSYSKLFISIILLSLCSFLIGKIFDFKKPIFYFLISLTIFSQPAIGSATLFAYTMPSYMLALLLIVCGFYLVERTDKIISYLVFSFFVSFAIGIYQAYYPFVFAMVLLIIMKNCFEKSYSFCQVILKSIKYIVSVLLSYVLYRIILNICLKRINGALLDYQGIDKMGQINFADLPKMIREMYYNYFLLFTHDYMSYTPSNLSRIIVLITIVLTVVFIVLCIKQNKNISKNILFCIAFISLPIASNFIIVMVPNGFIYTLMSFGLVSIFMLPVILLQFIDVDKNSIRQILLYITSLTLIIGALNYGAFINGCYRALQYSNIQTENYFSTLYTRIKNSEGYDENYKVVFVGENINDKTFFNDWNQTIYFIGGMSKDNQLNEFSRDRFIKNYLGYECEQISQKDYQKYYDTISTMNSYPNDNSIKIVDDVILVKFE